MTIDTEKIIHLTKTEWWREFKKFLNEKKQSLALELLYYEWWIDFEKKKITALAYDSIINLAENLGKKEELKKQDNNKLDSLWEINWLE